MRRRGTDNELTVYAILDGVFGAQRSEMVSARGLSRYQAT